jgi:3'-5' exoribonuclease
MSRRFISQLGQRENVDETFLASQKQLRANRNGNLYLQLQLSDRTGSTMAMQWNASNKVFDSFEDGNHVRVQGTTQLYNGSIQIIVTDIKPVDSETVDAADYCILSDEKIGHLTTQLSEKLRAMEDPALRNLAESFLSDEVFMANFIRAPAGVKNHHAYHGGLLEHVVGLIELVQLVATQYPQLNPDLMTMGAFLHDSGKINELEYEQSFAYSDEGQLIGHLVMGIKILEDKATESEQLSGESFPEELLLRLKHMIVSHHGEYEFGSPKLPMTPEAIALHFLDNLDAKMHLANQLITTDVIGDSRWTSYQPSWGRKLFKGSPVTEPPSEPPSE